MRFLIMLLMAFAVFVSLPTVADADVEVEVSMEQTADSVDASDDGTSDADLTPCMEIATALPAQRNPLPEVTSTTGPNGFSPGIWRPVARIESVLTRNYESGLALNRS